MRKDKNTRNAVVLMVGLLVSGCSGFDKFVEDTVTLPGDNPNMPQGYSDNLRYVQGRSAVSAPLLPEPGNVWPGAPRPLPTLKDVAAEHGSAIDAYRGYVGSDILGKNGLLSEGSSMSIGHAARKNSAIPDFSSAGIPTRLPGDLGKDLGKKGPASSSIVIPNGDGTSTLIMSDGTVKTVSDSKVPAKK